MTALPRRTLLALMGGAALKGCVPAAPAVSRNAPDPFEGGIGGTGIVGILTDFGSLRVNGLRVEMTNRTRVTTPFGPVSENALAAGQALTITAAQSRDRLVAQEVRIDHALIGRLDGRGRRLSVNGIPLQLEEGAVIGATPGMRVAVSGVWLANGLSATRIDPTAYGSDVIAGTVDRVDQVGVRVGDQDVVPSGPTPPTGSYLVAEGQFDGTALQANRLREGRFRPGGKLDQLSVEGYLEPSIFAPDYRIAGLGHSFGQNLDLAPLVRRRALYFGRYNGLFQASAGYVVPDSFAARRDLLRDGVPETLPKVKTLG